PPHPPHTHTLALDTQATVAAIRPGISARPTVPGSTAASAAPLPASSQWPRALGSGPLHTGRRPCISLYDELEISSIRFPAAAIRSKFPGHSYAVLFSSRGQPSPAEAAEIIAHLKDKSIEELQRLLKEKEAYNAFFNTFDQVKTQNNVRGELRKETLQLARENLEKEQRILELGNQCTIIRTTQLAAAQDRLTDLERQKDDIMRSYSPAALLDKLQTSMAKLDEESEELQQKFLAKDIDFPHLVQKYKKLRTAYHKQALLHLAGQT
uniref:VPS37 C-terminal domain-containing protein n=1 Tax=Zea mays TaxID=4577 RepID=A0A804UKT7_MAIZE